MYSPNVVRYTEYAIYVCYDVHMYPQWSSIPLQGLDMLDRCVATDSGSSIRFPWDLDFHGQATCQITMKNTQHRVITTLSPINKPFLSFNTNQKPRIKSLRSGKVDLQFIVRAFPKMHAGERSFFIISFGSVHVATETII